MAVDGRGAQSLHRPHTVPHRLLAGSRSVRRRRVAAGEAFEHPVQESALTPAKENRLRHCVPRDDQIKVGEDVHVLVPEAGRKVHVSARVEPPMPAVSWVGGGAGAGVVDPPRRQDALSVDPDAVAQEQQAIARPVASCAGFWGGWGGLVCVLGPRLSRV
jgi:hypothetical protein